MNKKQIIKEFINFTKNYAGNMAESKDMLWIESYNNLDSVIKKLPTFFSSKGIYPKKRILCKIGICKLNGDIYTEEETKIIIGCQDALTFSIDLLELLLDKYHFEKIGSQLDLFNIEKDPI